MSNRMVLSKLLKDNNFVVSRNRLTKYNFSGQQINSYLKNNLLVSIDKGKGIYASPNYLEDPYYVSQLRIKKGIISLNTAAYMAEIVRSGINSVDNGQIEAARSLGMTHLQTMFHIVWPQALKNAIPTIGNELIVNIKDSSVLNIITVSELFMAGKIAATTYMTVASYTIVALIYLALTLVSSLLLKILEKHMDKDTVRTGKRLKMEVVTYDD